MIDYLEQVLAGDREEGALAAPRRVAVRPPVKTEDSAAAAAGSASPAERAEQASPRTKPEPPEPPEETDPALRLPADWEAPEGPDPAWGDWLPQTGEQGGAAGILLGALARTRRGVRAVRGGQGVVTVTLPGTEFTAAGGLDAETMDLAVQRDARRYDGGFELY